MAKLLNYGDIVLPRRRKTIVLSIAIGILLLIVLAALLLPHWRTSAATPTPRGSR